MVLMIRMVMIMITRVATRVIIMLAVITPARMIMATTIDQDRDQCQGHADQQTNREHDGDDRDWHHHAAEYDVVAKL